MTIDTLDKRICKDEDNSLRKQFPSQEIICMNARWGNHIKDNNIDQRNPSSFYLGVESHKLIDPNNQEVIEFVLTEILHDVLYEQMFVLVDYDEFGVKGIDSEAQKENVINYKDYYVTTNDIVVNAKQMKEVRLKHKECNKPLAIISVSGIGLYHNGPFGLIDELLSHATRSRA